MPKNTLFNVISDKTAKEKTTPRGITLIPATTVDGDPYYRFGLTNNKVTFGDYTLDEHHVSVHPDMDAQRQYHYSAYFKGKEGKTYRLHLYFNEHDGYAGELFFAWIGEDGKRISDVDCIEYHEAFKAFAHLSMQGLIAQLRADQSTLITQLKAKYKELEKKSAELAKDLEKNKTAYLANVDSLLAILEQLGKYTDGESILFHQSYLKKLKKTQESQRLSSSRTSLESKEEKKGSAVTEDEIVEAPVASGAGSVSPENKKKDALTAKIATLKEQITALKQLKGAELVAAIITAHERLTQLDWDADEINSFESFYTLHELRVSLDSMGNNALQNLLMVGKYKEVEPLVAIYRSVPDSMLSLTLRQNNAILLNFLLKHKLAPLPFTNFSIREKRYTSMVDYFVQQTAALETFAGTSDERNKKSAELVACMDVVIKNGLSLLEIDERTGLPFAVHLLQENNPLRAALVSNRETTLDNPMFYKQLNQVLRVIAAQPDCPAENKALIEDMLNTNQYHISSKNVLGGVVGTNMVVKAHAGAARAVESAFGLKLLDKLRADPVITMLKKEIDTLTKSVLKNCPRDKRPKLVAALKNASDAITMVVKGFKDIDPMPSFSKIKEEAVAEMRKNLRSLRALQELIKIEIQLRSMASFKGKLTSKQKKLLNDQRKLVAQLKEDGSDQFTAALLDAFNTESKEENKGDSKEVMVDTIDILNVVIRDMLKSGSSAENIAELLLMLGITPEGISRLKDAQDSIIPPKQTADDDDVVTPDGDFLDCAERGAASSGTDNSGEHVEGAAAGNDSVTLNRRTNFFKPSPAAGDAAPADAAGMGLK